MKKSVICKSCLAAAGIAVLTTGALSAEDAPLMVPRFSIDYMDRSVEPGVDFFQFADGNWVKNNPIPADKARWSAGAELTQRNWYLLHVILDSAAADKSAAPHSPTREVGDFFRSAMDTNQLESLGFTPLKPTLKQIDGIKSATGLMAFLADLHERGVEPCFTDGVGADAKNSSVYVFELAQGGLGLPDRDYYLSDSFAKKREAYAAHITKMLTLLGEKPEEAKAHAATVLDLETALAQLCKPRADLRDPNANYNKVTVDSLAKDYPYLPLKLYLDRCGLWNVPDLVMHQPAFFAGLNLMIKERPLSDWKTYLRWHVVRGAAPYLNSAAESESFAFYGTALSGQPAMEPRWQRSGRVVDRSIGEALGQLFVAKNFPPEARARMLELVGNLKTVFRDHLSKLEWMSDDTRQKALAKFDLFTTKIGYPDKFRDYSKIDIRPDDYLGNAQRAAEFESKRELARVGQPVDKTEWGMTPPTVNAYFNPLQNEIVFPAGILQPPYFDVTMDDPVNYGAIGVVIGHEITHGYDDQGRKYDAHGNLNEWWTDADGKAFDAKAQKVVDQYNAYEPIPGLHVNGKLTLGENIADLGGTSIAYDAMERALAKDPAKRKNIDGFTPEQRFFISLAQIWRTNCRDDEARRLVTVDPHSPGRFRAVGPHVNMQVFYDAFNIKEGAPMWRAPELRAVIW